MGYPKALYRDGDGFDWDGRMTDRRVVESREEHDAALAEGWLDADDYIHGKAKADPLDHDGDGKKGGSLKGEESTRARGRRRKGESGK